MAVSLHSGKWTHEESEYVKELIKEFEAGSLNIQENISLRRFLSQALNCSAKRISKKFEGSQYNGKQLYKRKTSNLTPKEVEARRNKLRELERKYQESLRVLEMVEASRKPVHIRAAHYAFQRHSLTAPPLALGVGTPSSLLAVGGGAVGGGAGGADATAALGLPGISREARIAQLKADIALASMALESNTTTNAAATAAAVASSRRGSLGSSLERTPQSDILSALSSLPGSVVVRAPSPSSTTQLAAASTTANPLQTRLALSQLLVSGSATGARPQQALPMDIAALRAATATAPASAASTTTATAAVRRPSHLEGLKRGLEPPTALDETAIGAAAPLYKRLKLI